MTAGDTLIQSGADAYYTLATIRTNQFTPFVINCNLTIMVSWPVKECREPKLQVA